MQCARHARSAIEHNAVLILTLLLTYWIFKFIALHFRLFVFLFRFGFKHFSKIKTKHCALFFYFRVDVVANICIRAAGLCNLTLVYLSRNVFHWFTLA